LSLLETALGSDLPSLIKEAAKKAWDFYDKRSQYNKKKFFQNLQDVVGEIEKIYSKFSVYVNAVEPKIESYDFSADLKKINEMEKSVFEFRKALTKLSDDKFLNSHIDLRACLHEKLGPSLVLGGSDDLPRDFDNFEDFAKHVRAAGRFTNAALRDINNILERM